jgi:hypothetical protein
LNDVYDVVLFEMKALWLKDDLAAEDDYERFIRHLRERYGKAFAQLSRAISRISTGEWAPEGADFSMARRIYPVLLVNDPLVAVPVYTQFLASEFASALSPENTLPSPMMKKGRFLVAPLIVMTLDDLETLETSIEHFSLCDLLKHYQEADPERTEALWRFMILQYGERLRASQSVASKSIKLLEKTTAALFPGHNLIDHPTRVSPQGGTAPQLL